MHHLTSTIILATVVRISKGSPVEASSPEKAFSKRSSFYSNSTPPFVNAENHPFGQQYIIADYPNWQITLDAGHICATTPISWQSPDLDDTEFIIGPVDYLNTTLKNETGRWNVDNQTIKAMTLSTWDKQKRYFDDMSEACGIDGMYQSGRKLLQPQNRARLGQIDFRVATFGAIIFGAYSICKIDYPPK